MSGNFDWRTEEEEWDDGGPVGGRRTGRRRWVLPLVIVVAVIAAGSAISWQVRRRISAAEMAIRAEVISSFNLLHQAHKDGDIELFRNLLSGSDLEWAADQQELFAEEWLFDLSPFGLARRPEAAADIQVTFSPELNSAEVSAVSAYKPIGGSAGSETVNLQQTSVFRRGARWVWSPPKEEFWAGESSVKERWLAVTYPTRDEALVLRLARDLDSLVEGICGLGGQLACPSDQTLRLNFSHVPGALVDSSQRFASEGIFASLAPGRERRGRGLEITLPTPSLIGLPMDEAGYQALLHGYGVHVVMALIGRNVDQACCDGETGFRAATRRLLNEVGLDPWLGLEVDAKDADGAGPGQGQIALLCSQGFQRPQRLYLLELAHMTWQEQTVELELTAIKAMPDGDGLLLLGRLSEGDEVRSQVWRYTAGGADLLFDVPVSPAEAELVDWELQERQKLLVIEVPDLHQGYSRYVSIDLSACGDGDCASPSQSTVSRPVWSPDGSQLLVRAYGLLWWRVGASMVPIADGSVPFWVTEDIYGYARTFGQEQALVLVETGAAHSERVALTTSALRDAMEPATAPGHLLIARVIVSQPAGAKAIEGSTWYILVFEIAEDGSFDQARLLQFDPQSGMVSELPHAGRLLSYNLAPTGDKIAMGSFVEDTSRWEITFAGRAMDSDATLRLVGGGSAADAPSYSWSPDESWLLVLEQGMLTLFSPESGAVFRASPAEPGCVQAAWYGDSSVP